MSSDLKFSSFGKIPASRFFLRHFKGLSFKQTKPMSKILEPSKELISLGTVDAKSERFFYNQALRYRNKNVVLWGSEQISKRFFFLRRKSSHYRLSILIYPGIYFQQDSTFSCVEEDGISTAHIYLEFEFSEMDFRQIKHLLVLQDEFIYLIGDFILSNKNGQILLGEAFFIPDGLEPQVFEVIGL